MIKSPSLQSGTLEYEFWSKKRDGMQWWWQWLGGCAQLKRRGGCGGHAVAATAKLPSLTGCHAASLLFFKRACPPYSYCYVMTQVGSTNGLGLYTVGNFLCPKYLSITYFNCHTWNVYLVDWREYFSSHLNDFSLINWITRTIRKFLNIIIDHV